MLSTFFSACRDGDVASIARLLRKGQDMHSQQYNSEYHDFCSVLHVAAFIPRRYTAEMLLLHRACIDQESGECGWRPLHFSAARGDISMIRHLLGKESLGREDQDEHSLSPTYSAGEFEAGISKIFTKFHSRNWRLTNS
ncbi:hypothetical protein ABVK25_010949 [Lepraria finkii]|uniref:Uncharacterized protein n=1 Tax=Lepraria finkii TaxID=1340010 RepID=A0ABR4AV54_9LECA